MILSFACFGYSFARCLRLNWILLFRLKLYTPNERRTLDFSLFVFVCGVWIKFWSDFSRFIAPISYFDVFWLNCKIPFENVNALTLCPGRTGATDSWVLQRRTRICCTSPRFQPLIVSHLIISNRIALISTCAIIHLQNFTILLRNLYAFFLSDEHFTWVLHCMTYFIQNIFQMIPQHTHAHISPRESVRERANDGNQIECETICKAINYLFLIKGHF